MNTMRTMALMSLAFLGIWASFPALAAQADSSKPENVLKLIKSNKDLSKFASLIDSAGIESELSSSSNNLTIFAPTNAAMDKLSSDVLKRAKDMPDGLKSLVRYHIISGSVVYETNIRGRRAGPTTANGEMLGFDGTGKEMMVNQATIVVPDQYALNGVVHEINAVLIPESLKDPKIKQEAKEKELSTMMERRKALDEDRLKGMNSRQLEDEADLAIRKKEGDKKIEEEAKNQSQPAPVEEKATAEESKVTPVLIPETATDKKAVDKKGHPASKTDKKGVTLPTTATPSAAVKAPVSQEKTGGETALTPPASVDQGVVASTPKVSVKKEEKKGFFKKIFGN